MWKRVGAWILTVLAVVGLVLALGSGLGIWFVKEPVDRTVLGLLETVQSYAQAVNASLTDVDQVLLDAQRVVDEIAAQTEAMVAGGESPASLALRTSTGMQIRSMALTVGVLANGAVETIEGVNNALQSANRIPGVDVPTLDPAAVETLDATLTRTQENLQALAVAVAQSDGEEMVRLTADLATTVGQVEAVASALNAASGRTLGGVERVQASYPAFSEWGTVIFSLFMLLMAAGQWALLSSAWRNTRG
jgi:hypothetical protein